MQRFFKMAALAAVILCARAALADEPLTIDYPLGLTPMKIPDDNPLTKAKVELGKQLYFDRRLSTDDSVSCADCHNPKQGWSNNERFATGVRSQIGGRSAPTIINAGYQTRATFWDGRAAESSFGAHDALEQQALGPIQNPIEMDMKMEVLLPKLSQIEGYQAQFQNVFGTGITEENVAKAIAAFERTILSGNAPFDRWKAGDMSALSEAAERGRQIFFNKGKCSSCHIGPNFTDQAFHNLGVGIEEKMPDLGRYEVSKLGGDRGAFKTPTLREIARSAPYMHDGSLATLEEVVDFYDKGGNPNPQQDEEIFPLKLSEQEKADLVTFLKEGLSSDEYPDVEPPKLPQ